MFLIKIFSIIKIVYLIILILYFVKVKNYENLFFFFDVS